MNKGSSFIHVDKTKAFFYLTVGNVDAINKGS